MRPRTPPIARQHRIVVAGVALALASAAAPGRSAASEPLAWVVAGNASEGLRLPGLCPRGGCILGLSESLGWPATSIALEGDEAVAMPDGTLAMTSSSAFGLMKLGLDGRLRHWRVRFGSGAPSEALGVHALDAAPDGTLLATIQESGGAELSITVVRVAPDGVATRLGGVPGWQSHIAALPDGGAIVSNGSSQVWRAWANGSVTVAAGTRREGFAGDGGPATAARLSGTGAVAAMPDGGFLVYDSNNRRVRRVAPDGTISTVFGDGKFRLTGRGNARPEGASAIKFDGSDVTSLHADPEGGFYLTQAAVPGTETGSLLRVDPDGRVRSVRFAGPDGAPVAAKAVDVRADGSLVLVTGDRNGDQVRVVAPLERMQHLAVSFTARERMPVSRSEVEVLSTRSARARVDLSRGQRRLSTVDVDLHPGVNRVPIRIGRSGDVHVLRVRATSADGAIAAHRLPLIPGPGLSRQALVTALNALGLKRSDIDFSVVNRGCRRKSARRFACRTLENVAGKTEDVPSSVRLRRDGWLELVERYRQPRDSLTWVLEPVR